MTLSEAIGLARLFESRNLLQKKVNPSVAQLNIQPAKNKTNGISKILVRKLSAAELQDRRKRGLCYNCDEKFQPGHRCPKLFMIEGCLDEEDGDVIMEDKAAKVFYATTLENIEGEREKEKS